MKVFLSWSGDLSHEVAKALHQWLKLVIQATEPWLSSEGLDKGKVWFGEISDQLATTASGIICLTRENLDERWILFEAGALAKGLTDNRVYTFLIDVAVTDLKPPLSQFNATKALEADMFKMLKSINKSLGEKSLPEEVLRQAFDAHWPNLSKTLEGLKEKHKPTAKVEKRSIEDMMQELVETTRATHQLVQSGAISAFGPTKAQLRSAHNKAQEADGMSDVILQLMKDDPFLQMDVKRSVKEWARNLSQNSTIPLSAL